MKELNPNHEVTQALHDQWGKIASVLLYKLGLEGHPEIVITEEDIINMGGMFGGEMPATTCQEKEDGLHLKLVPISEGEKLAKEHGGLPS